jgi:hypothetical protein
MNIISIIYIRTTSNAIQLEQRPQHSDVVNPHQLIPIPSVNGIRGECIVEGLCDPTEK